MIRSDCRTTQAHSSDELRLRTRKYIDGSAINLSKTGDVVPMKTLDKTQQPKSCFERWKEVYDNLPPYQEFRGRPGEYFPLVIDEPCLSGEKYISDSLAKSLNDPFVNGCVKKYGLERGISIIIYANFKLSHTKAKTIERMSAILAIVSFVTELYAAIQIKNHGYIEATSSTPIERHFKTFIAKMSDDMDWRIITLKREIANLTKDEILKCIKSVRDNTTFSRDNYGCDKMLKDVQSIFGDIEIVLRAELPPFVSTEPENTPSKLSCYTPFVFDIISNTRKSLNAYKVYFTGTTDRDSQLYLRNEWFMIWKFMALQADHGGRENHFTIICRLFSVISSAFKSR